MHIFWVCIIQNHYNTAPHHTYMFRVIYNRIPKITNRYLNNKTNYLYLDNENISIYLDNRTPPYLQLIERELFVSYTARNKQFALN